MSAVKPLLDSLLWDIYGKQQQQKHEIVNQRQQHHQHHVPNETDYTSITECNISKHNQWNAYELQKLDLRKLIDFCAILKVEIRLMAFILERALIRRDRQQRHQNVLCGFVDAILHVLCVCILHGYYDVHPKMRFSLSPPPPKYTFIQDVTESTNTQDPTFAADKRVLLRNENNRNNNNNMNLTAKGQQNDNDIYVDHEGNEEEISDYIQWLHAMKLVARLPGGIPSEFRRKLWLSLADKYLKSKNINWAVEEEKCFCDKWREDDEELGVQIVKDLHRTGSTLCTGPTGDINQAKLKRILLGYARYNPEVGYCQGFNMLGALILQVMDKQESESIRVMIYLVEGILPTGYFCGSMGGLQADMAVFRELMQTKLPRLAKHLQKLQGPNENAYEPPLTNVFTMQWFLTMFCTCLPMNCVLRVWDLILIEGSDILLRTALVLWSLLEERVLMCYSADDFYGKMGSFSSKLLNGHLIDPNGLIEKIVQLGPITDIQTLREKHLYNITPLKHKPGIQLYYDGEEPDIDEDSQLAVATVWGLPWGRRSSTTPATNTNKQLGENKDRLALDISLLKKQYDRLRERQKQAHIILTTACSAAYQNTTPSLPNTPIPVNHLLLGCSAIVTNKGRRVGPPPGTIPPARKPSLPAVLPIRHTSISRNRLARGETIHDYGTSSNNKQLSRGSLTWKEIKAERAALQSSGSVDNFQSQKIRTRGSGKSDSSSYSEESEEDEVDSTTDTSLCDEDESESSKDAAKNKNNLHYSKVQSRKKLKSIVATSQKTISFKSDSNTQGNKRPKSWASSDIPFVLMTTDSPIHSADENIDGNDPKQYNLEKASENDANEHFQENKYDTDDRTISEKSIYGYSKMDQLSPIYDENTINNMVRPPVLGHSTDSENNETKSFDVSEEGVINEYFERVNIGERPVKLELSYSLPYEKSSQDTYIDKENDNCKSSCNFVEKELNPIDDYTADKILLNGRNAQEKDKFNLHKDYSKVSTKEYTPEVCTELTPKMDDICKSNYSSTRITSVTTTPNGLVIKQTAKDKRRDPRRLTRSYTIYAEDEQQYQKNNHISTIDKDPINIEKFRPKSDSLSFDENKRFELFNNEPSLSTYVLQGDNNKTNQELDIQQMAHKLNSIEDYRSPEEHTRLSTSPNKEDINFKQVSYTNKDDQFRKREKKSDNEDAGKEDDVREECLKANTENCKNTNSTTNNPVIRLKKIPSTAELEDRFNALERHNVIPQRSYSESKKEPPDGIAEVEIISENLNSNPHSHSQTPSTKVQKESEEKKEVPNTRKKTPPTTEELERRFQTLEKKLSGNNTNEKPGDSVPNRNENSVFNTDSPKVKEEHVSNGTSIKQIKSTSPREFDLKKAFEDKCKLINKNIVLDTEELLEESIKNNVKDKSESMTEKRRNVEEKSGKQNGSLEKSVKDEEKSPALKRRSSEPPTTEELERRYESLKRRMSSRVIEETEILEKETETPLLKSAITKKQAELSPTPIKNAKQFENKVLKNTSTADSSEKLSDPAISKAVPQKVTVETNRVKKDYSKEYPSPKKFAIPKAPTPPQYMKIDNANNYDLLQIQHNALIEELQSKIKTPENGENIKPSSINQKRTTTAQRSLYRTNEASEAHAVIAFYTSEKCEPWTVQSQNMVRRFSDLPSRADLENRLQFLEEQLSKKFHKQYIASDSEVSLRNKRLEEIPATYQSQRYAAHVNLEMRVQALEKQLSENSLKLLEAMGATAVAKADLSGDNLIVPRRLSTDTIDITGKELVKYTHVGELNELGAHHPINISINIKMSLQKSEHEDKLTDNNTQTLPTSQDLEKRLEQQVKTSAILTNECTESHQAEEREGKEDSQIEDSNEEVEVLVHPQHINDTDSENVGKNKDHKSIKQVEVRSNAEMIDELDKESNLYSSTQQNRMNTEECLKTGPEPNEMDKKEDLIMAQINDEDVTTLENKSEPNSEEKNNGNGTKLNEKIAIEAENLETPDSNKKTLVLLLDNQPKAVKVRRLTRANTEELEGLFQALEKQLSERNLIKAKDGTLKHATDFNQTQSSNNNENKCQAEAIAKLSQEITEFTKSAEEERNIENKVKPTEDEPYDWGSDPIKHHLKRKTVYLPSTKELEARFRSLERQIKLLEDVEKIDVEQRLKEIERKIQLQYSLSHEKDINRFLELCEDKNLPDEVNNCVAQTKSSLTSPCHKLSQDKNTQTPTRTVGFEQNNYDDIPSTDNLEYRFRALELHDSKKLNQMTTNKLQNSESGKKQPIHPLEMLLEPGSDDNVIPTTGELEHRLRILEEKKKPISPTPSRSKSQSPIGKHQKNFSTYHSDETHSPPTTEELEARLKALEQKHTFDFKMQKNFREFNQKLKNITLSPSTSFEEPKRDPKSREQSPKHSIKDQYSTVLSKSYQTTGSRSTSPKVIRFKDDEDSDIKYTPIGKERMVSTSTNNVLQTITENSKTLHRILKKTLTDGNATTASLESLNSIERMNRLMKETSPLRRSGTHTGVPLRTADNINDRLTSIQNTIKSIDTLCEEKPYCKEKCQRYIDSLFHDSVYMAHKKSSLEELTTFGDRSRSVSKGRQPSIHVSDLSLTGSATSIALNAAYIPQYRSTRDLRRDYSPRQRYSTEREECGSRVRRNYTLPIYFKDNFNVLNNQSNSLIKFHHQVDRQLNTNNIDVHNEGRLSKISPLLSPHEGTEITTQRTISKDNITTTTTTTTSTTTEQLLRSQSRLHTMDTAIPFLPRPISSNSSLNQEMNNTRFNTPLVYTPTKLEIRHTTVTSTFYDRLLTEKHLEKTKIKPTTSKSPLTSPSVSNQNNAIDAIDVFKSTPNYNQSYTISSPTQIVEPIKTTSNTIHLSTTDFHKSNTLHSSSPFRVNLSNF